MDSDKKTARIAGLLYLIVILNGFFFLKYVPSKLIVWNDASATVKNIIASNTLFRLGILSELIGYTAWLLLPLVLYKLLKPVNKAEWQDRYIWDMLLLHGINLKKRFRKNGQYSSAWGFLSFFNHKIPFSPRLLIKPCKLSLSYCIPQ